MYVLLYTALLIYSYLYAHHFFPTLFLLLFFLFSRGREECKAGRPYDMWCPPPILAISSRSRVVSLFLLYLITSYMYRRFGPVLFCSVSCLQAISVFLSDRFSNDLPSRLVGDALYFPIVRSNNAYFLLFRSTCSEAALCLGCALRQVHTALSDSVPTSRFTNV